MAHRQRCFLERWRNRPKAGLMMRQPALIQLGPVVSNGIRSWTPAQAAAPPTRLGTVRARRNGFVSSAAALPSPSPNEARRAVMDTRTISMGTMIYIGMAVTGNSTTTLATGVFDNVATTGSGATPTPTATNTPLPTNTPTATNTPVPTNTPTPTNTPAPSPHRACGGSAQLQHCGDGGLPRRATEPIRVVFVLSALGSTSLAEQQRWHSDR